MVFTSLTHSSESCSRKSIRQIPRRPGRRCDPPGQVPQVRLDGRIDRRRQLSAARNLTSPGKVLLAVRVDPSSGPDRLLDRGHLQCRPRSNRQLEVAALGDVRLHYPAAGVIRGGLQQGSGGRPIIDDFDPDGGSPKARLDDVGTGKRRGTLIGGSQQRPRQGG